MPKDYTKGKTLKQLARELGHTITFGMDVHCYVDGIPMTGAMARQLFRQKLAEKYGE